MLETIFDNLKQLDHLFWGYIAFIFILIIGSYFSFKTRFFQIRAFPSIFKTFIHFLKNKAKAEVGIHPLKVFFASVGGMIGIGNVVGIVTAVQIGGPGALLWVWIAAIAGSTIKYSEIYLGLKHRVSNAKGGYDGGPMFFLRKAFHMRWIPILVSILLCIYGVEIYQFAVLTDSLTVNWHLNRYLVIGVLLVLILYAGLGGIPRIAKICTLGMPIFMILYLTMGLWIIIQEITELPQLFAQVFKAAFTGHAAVGGFAGCGVFAAIQQGISRAAYSADIGIGYDSIIQSESNTVFPERQARLAILGVCIDNVVCTVSILIVLLSGVWKAIEPIEASRLVQTALSAYFPYMQFFMPFFLLLLGYTTLIAYFCVGIKCARFLHPKHGAKAYFIYAAFILLFFSFFDQTKALLVMSLCGSMLLMINLLGIFKLRHQVTFDFATTEQSSPTVVISQTESNSIH